MDDLDAAGSFGSHSPTSRELVRSAEARGQFAQGENRFPLSLAPCNLRKKYTRSEAINAWAKKNKIKIQADRFNLFESS